MDEIMRPTGAIMMEDTYASILRLDPATRGYVYFMRDAVSDELETCHVSFGYAPIANPNALIMSDDQAEDRKALEFQSKNYPGFFIVPFVKCESLDPAGLYAQRPEFTEIAHSSEGMIDTFFLADAEGGRWARVKKDVGYRVVLDLVYTLARAKFAEHFPDQYAAYSAATDPLRGQLGCL